MQRRTACLLCWHSFFYNCRSYNKFVRNRNKCNEKILTGCLAAAAAAAAAFIAVGYILHYTHRTNSMVSTTRCQLSQVSFNGRVISLFKLLNALKLYLN